MVLASGSDYPIHSNEYIKDYFSKNYPVNYFAFLGFNELGTNGKRFRKTCLSNRNNYWLSFAHTKFKLEIKPFCFVRPRCFKGQKIPVKEIFFKLPEAFRLFFLPKKLKKYKLNWCTSETWMEITYSTVAKLLSYIDKNPYLMELGKYIHNPEEILMQTVINTIEKQIPRKDYLINCKQRLRKNGSLEITDADTDFVTEEMSNPGWLYMRKFSSQQAGILDYIDKKIKENAGK